MRYKDDNLLAPLQCTGCLILGTEILTKIKLPDHPIMDHRVYLDYCEVPDSTIGLNKWIKYLE